MSDDAIPKGSIAGVSVQIRGGYVLFVFGVGSVAFSFSVDAWLGGIGIFVCSIVPIVSAILQGYFSNVDGARPPIIADAFGARVFWKSGRATTRTAIATHVFGLLGLAATTIAFGARSETGENDVGPCIAITCGLLCVIGLLPIPPLPLGQVLTIVLGVRAPRRAAERAAKTGLFFAGLLLFGAMLSRATSVLGAPAPAGAVITVGVYAAGLLLYNWKALVAAYRAVESESASSIEHSPSRKASLLSSQLQHREAISIHLVRVLLDDPSVKKILASCNSDVAQMVRIVDDALARTPRTPWLDIVYRNADVVDRSAELARGSVRMFADALSRGSASAVCVELERANFSLLRFKRVEAHGTADFRIAPTSAYRDGDGARAVVFHDDPYTTMEYVVDTLIEHFTDDRERAKAQMLEVHETGRSVVAVLSHEEATAKAASIIERAERAGHPLRVTVEPAPAEQNV